MFVWIAIGYCYNYMHITSVVQGILMEVYVLVSLVITVWPFVDSLLRWKKVYLSVGFYFLSLIVCFVIGSHYEPGKYYKYWGYSFILQPLPDDPEGYMKYEDENMIYYGMSNLKKVYKGVRRRVPDGYGVAILKKGGRIEGLWEYGRFKGVAQGKDGRMNSFVTRANNIWNGVKQFDGEWRRIGHFWSRADSIPKKGTCYYYDGTVFKGTWEEDKSVKKGIRRKGIFFYPSGEVVEGEWIGQTTEPFKIKMKKDGIFYKYSYCYNAIQYVNGKFISQTIGESAHVNREDNMGEVRGEYIGHFKENGKTGYGWFRYTNGRCYKGFFTKGKFNGEGTLYDYNDEVIRTGKWNNEEPMDFCGDEFLSEEWFLNEERSLSKSEREEREWFRKIAENTPPSKRLKTDAFVVPTEPAKSKMKSYRRIHKDTVIVTFEDGTWYRHGGGWADGKRWHGRTEYSNGDLYEGWFKDDKLTGRGTYITSTGHKYKGTFIDGKLNGWGLHYDKNYLVYCGYWKDGKSVPKKK